MAGHTRRSPRPTARTWHHPSQSRWGARWCKVRCRCRCCRPWQSRRCPTLRCSTRRCWPRQCRIRPSPSSRRRRCCRPCGDHRGGRALPCRCPAAGPPDAVPPEPSSSGGVPVPQAAITKVRRVWRILSGARRKGNPSYPRVFPANGPTDLWVAAVSRLRQGSSCRRFGSLRPAAMMGGYTCVNSAPSRNHLR